ncbi:MAG TPA: hypothetical protein VNA11_15035 [Pseudonocardia sp.]|nr:hypothetical protein [Pseudonocardia sp.]
MCSRRVARWLLRLWKIRLRTAVTGSPLPVGIWPSPRPEMLCSRVLLPTRACPLTPMLIVVRENRDSSTRSSWTAWATPSRASSTRNPASASRRSLGVEGCPPSSRTAAASAASWSSTRSHHSISARTAGTPRRRSSRTVRIRADTSSGAAVPDTATLCTSDTH